MSIAPILLLFWGGALFAAASTPLVPSTDLTKEQLDSLVRQVGEKQLYQGDFKTVGFVKENQRGREPKICQIEVYRRAADDKILLLFTKPKQDAGKGYLKIDKNIWFYDPSSGKWDRRTEREQLGGTGTHQQDFDSKDLEASYVAGFDGSDRLGEYNVYKVRLTARSEQETAYPLLVIWIDKGKRNILKREEYSKSGKLLRTIYYPKWEERKTGQKEKPLLWVATELRIYDEIEKGHNTIVQINEISFGALAPSIFSKAWVENKSR